MMQSCEIESLHGVKIDLLNPTVDMIDVRDITAALSNLCRWTGHICVKDDFGEEQIYSIAKHSVYIEELVPDCFKKAALLHDAAEAYIGDLSSPLKRVLPEFKKIENKFMEVIALKFDVDFEDFAAIKSYDLLALKHEYKYLRKGTCDWFDDISEIGPPTQAYLKFLSKLTIEDTRILFKNHLMYRGVT